MISVAAEQKGSYLILHLVGRIGGEGSVQFYHLVKENVEESDLENVALDFAKVDFIDSSGLGSLVAIHTNLKKKGRKLLLASAPDNLVSLLKMTNLLNILELAPDWRDLPGMKD